MRAVAVCCGFNDYERNPLDRAVNDAAILYARLMESGVFNAAPDLIGKSEVFTQPTSAEAILAAFRRAAASTAELVWFSFSGHAMVSGDGELRLVLPGWRRDAGEDERRACSIGASEIARVLQSALASKKFVVMLDTCHSGAFGHAAVTRDVTAAIGEQVASAGAVVISSCASDQLASDGDPASRGPNGAFTAAVVEVLGDHLRRGAPLSVLGLFLEAKARVRNGQLPTLYANGLTDDFAILGAAGGATPDDGVVPLAAEVPVMLKNELETFLSSVVQLRRRGRLGLSHAERQLESLAAEFYRYGDDAFVVPGHSATVGEAFDHARRCIVGCTTPAYVEEWRGRGLPLLGANRELITRRGGRVIRLFFVPDGYERRVPAVLDVVRDHVAAGVLAVVIDVDSFGPAVLEEVLGDAQTDDLRSLECAFVDGKIFLKTHFAASGDLKIELDQRPTRCQHEYKAKLRPFLSSPDGVLLGAEPADGHDGIELRRLGSEDIAELRQQLEADLGLAPAIGAAPAVTPGAAPAPAGGWRGAGGRPPSRPGRG